MATHLINRHIETQIKEIRSTKNNIYLHCGPSLNAMGLHFQCYIIFQLLDEYEIVHLFYQ